MFCEFEQMYNDIKSILNEKKYFKCQYDVLKKEFG